MIQSSEQLPSISRNDLPIEPVHVDTLEPTRFGMLKKLSLLVRLFFVWIYARVVHEPSQVQDILDIPKQEPIVYLLASENKHDFLFLNDLCLKTGMPLAYTSNGKSKLGYGTLAKRFLGLFGSHKDKFSPEEIAQSLLERKPILIFLNQFGIQERKNKAHTNEIFKKISTLLQNHPNLKIHFVPVGIIWERREEAYNHSFLNTLYGTPTRPSSIRRFISVLPGLVQLFFKIGKPLCLIHHIEASKDNISELGNLQQTLHDDIDMMHTQVNGPKVKPHQLLLNEIIESEDFQTELQAISQDTGQSQEELSIEARKILDNAAAKFKLVVCKLFSTFLAPMWTTIYNGLYYDPDKMNEIRELSKTHRLVFIPSHKSHIDYLVLSIMMFQHGVMPPHIAAGENLNFFPIGSILRRGGAFFIKRSFRGERLYSACIRYYIDKIMHEGFPVEFFIEGGRSRTGQVLQPKFGILRMVAQAVQNDPAMPVKIIPCAITYEKVIEDIGYKNEQDGGSKQKESFSNLIKTTKLLISKYGQIYVSFADPIDLNESLHTSPDKPKISDQQLTQYIDKMASELMMRINGVSTITTSSLFGCAVLQTREKTISIDSLLQNCAFLLSLLIERNAQITPVLQTALAASRVSLIKPDASGEMPQVTENTINPIDVEVLVQTLREPILETIKLFEQNGTVKHHDTTIEIPQDERLQITFYKNFLLFALIEDIYLAYVILYLEKQEFSKDDIIPTYHTLADILSIEFSSPKDDTPITDALDRFKTRGWLTQQDDKYIISDHGKECCKQLIPSIAHHIDSYKTVFQSFGDIQETIEESKLLASLLSIGKSQIASNQCLPESRSKVIYAHGLQKLQEMKLFDVTYQQNGRKHAKLLTKIGDIPSEIMNILIMK